MTAQPDEDAYEPTDRTMLGGQYRVLDHVYLYRRARKVGDPRNVFYDAMLSSRTYEEYLERIAGIEVAVPTYKSGPISGRMEMLYARRNNRIGDVQS